jgi:hypothetical protein
MPHKCTHGVDGGILEKGENVLRRLFDRQLRWHFLIVLFYYKLLLSFIPFLFYTLDTLNPRGLRVSSLLLLVFVLLLHVN